MARLVWLVCLLVLTLPSTAAAQLSLLEGLFESIEDANVFATGSALTNRAGILTAGGAGDDGSCCLYGFGIEVGFKLAYDRSSERVTETAVLDTVAVEVRTSGGADAADSIIERTYRLEPRTRTDTVAGEVAWQLELALGYTQSGNFAATDETLDFRGSMRELPSVTLYATLRPEDPISFYLGFRSGVAQLHGFRSYVAAAEGDDAVYTATGTAFQIGLILPSVALNPWERASIFVEPSYTYRSFETVEWDAPDGTLPDALPRSLDMSTFTVSVGLQLALPQR